VFRAIKNYKNLIRALAVTDFKLKYQGSILGYLWSLVKPLMLFSILYFVFTRVFSLGNEIDHYPVYLLLGIVVWNFFVETSVTCLYSIVGKGDLIRKVYFPRIVLIISANMTSFLVFIANSIIIALFMILTGVEVRATIFIAPLLLLELFLFVTGVGLILSSIFVKFRDVAHIWEVILQALFYATPILYSPNMLPGLVSKIAMLNPMAQILQDFRYVVVSKNTVTAFDILGKKFFIIPYIIPIAIFTIGLLVFEKMASKFAEEV
jgi:ABC-2 type transport system permease protein